jgi:hypothetical protein
MRIMSILGRESEVIVSSLTVCIQFGYLNCLQTPFVREQRDYAATASHRKKTQFSVRELTADYFEHYHGVGAGQPLGFRHRVTSRLALRLLSSRRRGHNQRRGLVL